MYVERELFSIKCDGIIRDTEWSAKATPLLTKDGRADQANTYTKDNLHRNWDSK